MPDRPRDFLVGHLDEMAAVVDLGQRVVGGELVDLLVVARFHAVLADELEDALADGDLVAVGQHGVAGDAGFVHAGGVGRAEVADAVAAGVAPDPAMFARHALVDDDQVDLLRAADHDRRLVDVGAPAEALAMDHHHACRARRGPQGSVAQHGALGGVVELGVRFHSVGWRVNSRLQCSACTRAAAVFARIGQRGKPWHRVRTTIPNAPNCW